MLLAAGRSTRLGALGQALPKPLVPICGYPAIRFGIANLAAAGLRDLVVNLHHHGELLRAELGDGGALGVTITYSEEPELLGTGGGLAKARALLGPAEAGVVVMNAKVVADLDLAPLVAAHAAAGADATLVLKDDANARRWGAISSDAQGRVVGILDAASPRPPQGPVVERMFTGVQIVGPAVLDRLRPVFSDSIRHGYMPALVEGAAMRAEVLGGYFAEHSTPERYLAGNLALLRAPALIRNPPGPLTGADPSAEIHPTATLVPPYRVAAGAVVAAGATVGPDTVIGAGARVGPGVRITRSVLWPGTRATTDLDHTVLTSEGPVPVAT
jgi:NDP-sugar pyrophosphorylase family protein